MCSAGIIEPGGGVGLTSAEMKVLASITGGLTNREIADALAVSAKSIQWHAEHAYRKIGVGSRQEAVTWCLLHGFDPPGESGPG
jgi:DNA-binding CsgD family transcriptional regulator